jgi:hypothetical protein
MVLLRCTIKHDEMYGPLKTLGKRRNECNILLEYLKGDLGEGKILLKGIV